MENQDMLLKEYEMLRTEILDRSKRENDSLVWSLTLLVALFGTNSIRIEVISIIPIAFSFFGYIWLENSLVIYILGKYIKIKIEDKLYNSQKLIDPSRGWENFIKTKQFDFKRKGNTYLIIPILYFGLISISAIGYQIVILLRDKYNLLYISIPLNLIIVIFYFLFLDSLNADVYWGFGNLLGTKHEFRESLPLLDKSIKLNPNNPKVYECLATSYGQLFFETKDVGLLNKTIDNLKISIQLNPKSASAFGQLTGAYSYFTQKDSARKYLALTDNLTPKQ